MYQRICITGNLIASDFQPDLPSQNHKVTVKRFSGTKARDMHNNIKPVIYKHNFYVGFNDALGNILEIRDYRDYRDKERS